MKINDTRTLPAGTHYYEVSEEVWYQTGPDDADRDFTNFVDFDNLLEAVAYTLTAETERRGNRLYIDLMVKTENGGAHGLPVWAGYKSQLMKDGATSENGWRFSNFNAMGVTRPELVAA
jgi:hypothetical protein